MQASVILFRSAAVVDKAIAARRVAVTADRLAELPLFAFSNFKVTHVLFAKILLSACLLLSYSVVLE